MKKFFFALFISTALFIMPLDNTYASAVFNDVTDQHHAKAEFDFLVNQGILTADPLTSFGINENITRIEAVKILSTVLHLDLNNSPVATFHDVTADDENLPLISAIVNAKIMSGNEHGEFRPDENLTRAQMASILVKAFSLNGTTGQIFKDVSTANQAATAIQILVANQITTGYEDNTFRPTAYLTKSNFVVFLARILNPDFRKELTQPIEETPAQPSEPVIEIPKSCEKPSSKTTYKVNVAVTNIWDKPTISRKVDAPSLQNPVEMKTWVSSMNLTQKRWLVDRIDTQSIYGDEVTVLTSSGNWYRIALHDQYVPYQKEGYPGWVPKSHVTAVKTDYSDCAIAVVTSDFAPLYNEINKKKFMEISYSTILPVVNTDATYYHVQTPANGIKLLRKADAKSFANYADIPKPTQKTIIDEAKRYLGLPYLWAGTSPYGFDCSGIIYSVYRNHGIMIPRDSFYQATNGNAVAKSKLQPGDLVFFAYNNGKGKVYHVGLYVGNGKMLHAPNPSSKVRIESLNTGVYKKNYYGAKRYLN